MAKQAGINKFFSPRVQGQFTPQFVEEQFPFQEAFLVGAGQQQRIDDLVAQATELGQVETRPLESDILARDQATAELEAERDEILARNAGDPTKAANDLARLISRTKQKDFFKYNAANLETYKQDVERQQKFQDPVTLSGDSLTESQIDPETGRFRVFQPADIIERPNFGKVIEDRYGDLKAVKTQGPLGESGEEGILGSKTTTILTPEDIRAHSKDSVEDFLSSREGEAFAVQALEQGVSEGNMLEAAENIIFSQLKDLAQNDVDIEFRNKPKKDTEEVSNADTLGVGTNISANVASGNNTTRAVATVNETTGEQTGLNLTSENEYTLRQSTKAGGLYKMLVSPGEMFDLENLGARIPSVGEEDFELDKVQDFLVITQDDVIDGVEYKAGQLLPEEAVLGKTLQELKALGVGVDRKFFAVGRIEVEEEDSIGEMVKVNKSVAIPYESVKKTLKAKTATAGKGGFELNKKDFFKDELTLPSGIIVSVGDLKSSGLWSDAQIQQLRELQ